MKVAFATLFDCHYLARALVMVRSLRRHAGVDAPAVHALCLDEPTLAYLRNFPEPGVVPLALADLEAADAELVAVKANRRRLEYYFTLSPCLPRYLLRSGGLDGVVSLDADLWFLRNPSGLVSALEDRSLFITAHGFSRDVGRGAADTGCFNVSFQGFRNDATGHACLDRWRVQCLDWCRNRVDRRQRRYADQRYLDSWTRNYPGAVTVLHPPLAGLAPWNLARFPITADTSGVKAAGHSPVFFHFHGVRFIRPHLVADNLWKYHVVVDEGVRQYLYAPYLAELSHVQDEVSPHLGDDSPLNGPGRGGLLPLRLWLARTWFHIDPPHVATHSDLYWMHPLHTFRRIVRKALDRLHRESEDS